MQTGNKRYIYKNDFDKLLFLHDVTYVRYKDLSKRTELDKLLRDKAFKIASNAKYDGFQRGLASMVYKFFDKKSKGFKSMSIQQLADKFYKPIIEKLKKKKFILHIRQYLGC